MSRSQFEINYNLLSVFYNKTFRFGLYLRTRPRDWLKTFWGHPEADVLWYDVGPFAFFKG